MNKQTSALDKQDLAMVGRISRLIHRLETKWWFRWFAKTSFIVEMSTAVTDLSFLYYRHTSTGSIGQELKENK